MTFDTFDATDLAQSDHDLDGLPPGTPPTRSVVICANAGPHGRVIAAALRRCGVGVPMPYLDTRQVAPRLVRRWGVERLDEYISALHHHRSTADGVFSLVLGWRDLRRVTCQVIGRRHMTHDRVWTVVETIAPEPTFVFVRHPDPDRQAVAVYLDDHTIDVHTGTVAFDAAAIDRRRTLLAAGDAAWDHWLDAVGADRTDLWVEPDDDLTDTLAPLLTGLGADPAALASPGAGATPFAALTNEFLTRFRAATAEPAPA